MTISGLPVALDRHEVAKALEEMQRTAEAQDAMSEYWEGYRSAIGDVQKALHAIFLNEIDRRFRALEKP